MSKLLLGVILGAVLGLVDGLTSLFTPEARPMIMTILMGSTFKGLVAGVIIGFFARKVDSLPWGIIFGLLIAVLVSLPFALATDPTTGNTYFWEIMIPGSLVGLILGYATQKYGMRTASVKG